MLVNIVKLTITLFARYHDYNYDHDYDYDYVYDYDYEYDHDYESVAGQPDSA